MQRTTASAISYDRMRGCGQATNNSDSEEARSGAEGKSRAADAQNGWRSSATLTPPLVLRTLQVRSFSPHTMFRAAREFLQSAGSSLRPSVAHCAPAAATPAEVDAEEAAALALAAATPAPASFVLYQVLGWPECPWFHRAACITTDLSTSRSKAEKEAVEVSLLPTDRETFARQLNQLSEMLPESAGHNSCPAIVSTVCHRRLSSGTTEADAEYDCDEPSFVGGYSQLETQLQQRFGFKSRKCDYMNRATGVGAGACPMPPQPKK